MENQSQSFINNVFYNYYKDAYPDEPAVQVRMCHLDPDCPQVVRVLLNIDYNEWCRENKILYIKNF